VVLVDTPGVHKPDTQLDRRMMQEVHDALESRDAVLFIVDVTHRLPRLEKAESGPKTSGRMALSAAEDDFVLSLIRKLDCPVILVLNKMDAVRKEELLPLIAHWSSLHTFADVIPISARKKEGLGLLLDKIVGQLKEGQRYFPKHQLTDQPERFLVAELIREKILMLTGEEVPYATAVVIEKFEEPASMKKMKDGKLPVTKISAAIFCERTGQKAILIGKQGEMLKKIGTAARKDIESLLGTRVFLELFVKVQEEWRSSRGFVEELDWRRQLELIAAKQAAEDE
jgi:GTPase